jgi:hypothetical protein
MTGLEKASIHRQLIKAAERRCRSRSSDNRRPRFIIIYPTEIGGSFSHSTYAMDATKGCYCSSIRAPPTKGIRLCGELRFVRANILNPCRPEAIVRWADLLRGDRLGHSGNLVLGDRKSCSSELVEGGGDKAGDD